MRHLSLTPSSALAGTAGWRRPAGRLARWLWLLAFATAVVFFFASLPLYYDQVATLCTQVRGCAETQIRSATAAALAARGISLHAYAVFQVVLSVVLNLLSWALALLIFWRRPLDWLTYVISLLLALLYTFPATATLPLAYPALALPIDLIGFFTGSAVPLLFYAFPNGRFEPRFTRLLAAVWIAIMFSENLLHGTALDITRFPIMQPVFALLLASFAGAQLYRYHFRSTPVERQQTKWVVYGLLLGTGIMFGFNVALAFAPPALRIGSLLTVAKEIGDSSFAFILTFTLTVAILRYRLWDIDLLIRRTLIYAILVAALALVYYGSVILLQSLFRQLTGQDSDLAIVLSTLAIAALFTPLQRRVRTFINRRFYRRKYDASQTLAAFAATLRYEVELDNLTDELLRAIQDTVEPSHLSVWLRSGDR
jgi:hypothetical protein